MGGVRSTRLCCLPRSRRVHGQHQEKGIPQHPASIVVLRRCLGTALAQLLEFCPRHMFFPLSPGCRITPSASRAASPALPCPGVTEPRSDKAGTSAHPRAALRSSERRTFRVVEHHLVVPWPRTHVHTPPPEDPLPRKTGRSALTPPTAHLAIFPSNFLISLQLSEPDMVFQGGWGW